GPVRIAGHRPSMRRPVEAQAVPEVPDRRQRAQKEGRPAWQRRTAWAGGDRDGRRRDSAVGMGLGVDLAGVAGAQQRSDLPQGGHADQGVDHPGQRGILAAEDGRDQVELGQADQAPVDATDDHEGEGDEVEGFHAGLRGVGRADAQPSGMRTVSITWMTPLLAATSVAVTRAPSTVTPSPEAAMARFPPCTVVAESIAATRDAGTLPGTTW